MFARGAGRGWSSRLCVLLFALRRCCLGENGEGRQFFAESGFQPPLEAQPAKAATTTAAATDSYQSGPKAVRAAVAAGDLEALRQRHVAPAPAGPGSATLLHLAVSHGHAEVAQWLLDQRVPVGARDDKLRIPLHLAAERGDAKIAGMLLERAALATDAVNSVNAFGWAPLHWAARSGSFLLTGLFLHHRAVVDARGQAGCTPLHWAAQRGHLAIAQLLLRHGARAELADDEGRTAATRARLAGHASVAKFIEAVAGRAMAASQPKMQH